MPAKSKGPFCQSCGMPMLKPGDFGTENTGIHSNEYCHYCYADGCFTTPRMTMADMLDVCVDAMARQGMPKAEARKLMIDVLPRLKRWSQPVPAMH